MAIAHDTDSNSGAVASAATSFSWTHTCTGSNLILIVSVGLNETNSHATVTGVTYNSVSLTNQQVKDAGNPQFSYLWVGYLINPASGANTVTVTLSNATNVTNGNAGAATSFTGVNQSTPIDASGWALAESVNPIPGSASTNIITIHANAFIVDAVMSLNGTLATVNIQPQAPQVLTNQVHAGNGSSQLVTSYNGPIVTPASTSDGYAVTGNGADDFETFVGFSLNPAPGGGGGGGTSDDPWLSPWIGNSLRGVIH